MDLWTSEHEGTRGDLVGEIVNSTPDSMTVFAADVFDGQAKRMQILPELCLAAGRRHRWTVLAASTSRPASLILKGRYISPAQGVFEIGLRFDESVGSYQMTRSVLGRV